MLEILPNAERRAVNNCVRNYLRQAAAEVRWLKDIFEDATNIDPGAFIGIEAKRAMPEVERPNVVESENMVGMAVRHQYGVKVL